MRRTSWRSHRTDRPPHHRTPTIRFTPTAWAKLLWLRDRGDTEIGGFGITSPEDRLRVEDVVLVPQGTTGVSVAFDDVAVAEFFEDQVDQGRRPEQFARIWMHTHPGDCPLPSPTDEETFARVFGGCDWAVMLILARGGATYARLEWHVGPRGALLVPVTVDYRRPFAGSDEAAWAAEYDQCVVPLDPAEVWGLGEHDPFLRRDSDARLAVAAGVSGPGGERGGCADAGRASISRAGLDHPGPELGLQRRDLVPGRDESPDGSLLRPDAGGGRVPAVV